MKYQDERKETPFSARDYMLDIWDHTLELCFRNFGKKKRKPPKEPSNFAEWSPESRDRWTAQQQEKLAMAEAFDATFIQNETRVLDALCRKIVFAIDAANTMPTIYVCECEAVRLKQDEAIGLCSNLKRELNHIAMTIPSNANYLAKLTGEIDKEIRILSGWRKSCNGLREKAILFEKQQRQRIEEPTTE